MNFYSYPGIMNKLKVEIELDLNIQPRYVLSVICKYFKQDPEKVIGPVRTKELVHCRCLFAFFLRKKTKCSLNDVGYILGKRDHTTIINSLKKIKSHSELYQDINYEIHQLEMIFRTKKRKNLQSKIVKRGSLTICYGYDHNIIKPGYFFEVLDETLKTSDNPLGVLISQEPHIKLDHNQMYSFMKQFKVGSKNDIEKVMNRIPL